MDEHIRDRLLIALTFGAGVLDAVLYLKLRVLPANMTGNTVMLALSVVERDLGRFLPAVLALGGFAAGAALAGKYVGLTDRAWSRVMNRMLFLAAGLILIAALPGLLGREEHIWSAAPLCAAAMGIQAICAQHLSVQGVSTNAVTATIALAMARFVGPAPGTGKFPLVIWIVYLGGALIGALCLNSLNWHTLWFPTVTLAGSAFVAARCTGGRG